jgi:hypothetical protein
MTEDRDRGPLDFEDDPPAEHVPLPEPSRAGSGSTIREPGRFLWVVGAAAAVLVLVLGIATLRHGTQRGARGVPVGTVMPPFAVPAAASRLNGDANIATKSGEGDAGHEPACSVRGSDIVNGCALREAGPVVLAFFAANSEKCVAELDAMQQVLHEAPGVQFAAIAIRGNRDDLRAMIRRHGWSFPVGYDHDGALTNAYHVQVCPQLTFARRGGRVVDTTFGDLTPSELAAKARSLGAS